MSNILFNNFTLTLNASGRLVCNFQMHICPSYDAVNIYADSGATDIALTSRAWAVTSATNSPVRIEKSSTCP